MMPVFRRGVSSLLLLLPLFAGAAAAQSGSLMIADFEGGKLETVSGLALVALTDEQMGGLCQARLSLIHPGAQGSKNALRIAFHMADGSRYPFASVSALLGTQGLATDLSAYKGVRFYARSHGGSYLAGVGQFSGQAATYMAAIETKPEWTLFELPFDKLQRTYPPATTKEGPFVPLHAVSIDFSVMAKLRGDFELDLDQLELYK